MGRARWCNRGSRGPAPVIGAVIFGLLACLHVEGAPRDPDPDPANPRTTVPEGARVDRSAESSMLGDEAGTPGSVALAGLPSVASDEPDRSLRVGAPRDDEVGAGEASEDDPVDAEMREDVGRDDPQDRSRSQEQKSDADDNDADDDHQDDANKDRDRSDEGESDAAPSDDVSSDLRVVEEHPPPSISMATVLGSTRRQLARRLGAEGEDGDSGWVHYDRGLAIRFEGKRAVESAIRVPTGLTCIEAARWAGFERSMPPLRRTGGCAWPGISARHRLHRGVVGELAWTTGILQIWSAKGRR